MRLNATSKRDDTGNTIIIYLAMPSSEISADRARR
jgi:hypothetical protein